MIYCSCNGITDGDVKRAFNAGARRPAQVYKACGTKPNCGRCIESFAEEIESLKALAERAQYAPAS